MADGPYWDEQRMQGAGEFPHVLAIGDSWFWYPFNNLLTPIWNYWGGNRVILAQGTVGAEAVDLASGRWLRDFRRILKWNKSTIRTVLMSAGGNDFAGMDDMSRILKPDCRNAATGEDCFDADEAQGLMFHDVANAYRTLIGEVAERCPEAYVVLHNYDYAIPSGKAIFGLGHWLKDPMDAVGVPAAVQPLAVDYLIDTFSSALALVQHEFPLRTLFVNSVGTLDPSDWANELHPTPSGFNKLVDVAWAPQLANLP